MASQSPWSWQLKRTGYSAIKLPNSLSSSNSSIIFTFRTVHKKQTSLSTFSLDPSSSSSSSSRVCSASHNVGKGLRKSVKNPENDGDDKPQNEVSVNRPRSRKSRTPLSFKSLFGRKSLWRRIVFASRKTRSIILLNVITLIYGSGDIAKRVKKYINYY